MADLLKGTGSRDDYIALVSQHYFIYEALEAAGERMRRDPVASVFITDKLTRLPALEADLEFLIGENWREEITPLPSTQRYVDRINEVGAVWAGGFVAHHYTRYMGDLSGGQYIGLQVRKMLGLSAGDDGVRFYRFAGKPKAYKDRYRVLLDAAPWDAAEQDRVIGEVKAAYRLNAALTRELGEGLRHTAA